MSKFQLGDIVQIKRDTLTDTSKFLQIAKDNSLHEEVLCKDVLGVVSHLDICDGYVTVEHKTFGGISYSHAFMEEDLVHVGVVRDNYGYEGKKL